MSTAVPAPPPIPRTALVTGAARRIGAAIARDLAHHGWAVVLHCHRSRAEADDLADELRAAGGRVAVVTADLAREDEVHGVVPAAVAALGPLGLLVNNASRFERDEVATATRASWDLHLEANLRAPFVLCQAFAGQVPDGAGGAIVNLLDQRVWNLTPHFVSYTVSKAALWTLTQTLALALAPRIRVNGVGPGPVLPSTHQTEAQFRRQWEAMPLARPTPPEEIAAAVRFLAEAPSITGQMLALDGGEHLAWAQPTRGVPPDQ